RAVVATVAPVVASETRALVTPVIPPETRALVPTLVASETLPVITPVATVVTLERRTLVAPETLPVITPETRTLIPAVPRALVPTPVPPERRTLPTPDVAPVALASPSAPLADLAARSAAVVAQLGAPLGPAAGAVRLTLVARTPVPPLGPAVIPV